MLILVSLLLFYLVCSILAYGRALAAFEQECPGYPNNKDIAARVSMFGPVGLAVSFYETWKSGCGFRFTQRPWRRPVEEEEDEVYYDSCGFCPNKSGSYETFPKCRECGEHTCPACTQTGTVESDEGRLRCYCKICWEEMQDYITTSDVDFSA